MTARCPFQSTRPRGRTRPPASETLIFGILFQSTRPRGRTRLPDHHQYHRHYRFNPRVLAGGRDLPKAGGSSARIVFQSTRPRGRTRLFTSSSMYSAFGFNPRVLAGGRDLLPALAPSVLPVSIHASSREDATINTPEKIRGEAFQSTRPRGRTRRTRRIPYARRSGFNPRVLAGGRDYNLIWNEWFRDVSIHASSREDATCEFVC